ncbi:F-box protein AUF2-like [Lycium ferocissimum]|uniref:F-box protein AUF2-like n=1 Tax=Lycium ferocissimum TaxID=112874 RepID=UPI0028154A57|nr:F-box protein AUF2-like [Lycium ferocissimum]XP_059279796.1 F-box protein AUF2-like [Lycium ferocissimum]XP_059279797.1 F-box protein AUF2-like [Lycium ferocissimum]XP_059279798.1 F-box protein AUF2-like [Lycium ferocissimum]
MFLSSPFTSTHTTNHSFFSSKNNHIKKKNSSMAFELDNSDGFDRIPDPLIHIIFNQISDIKTLIRCRSVSKRFNSLVPQADSLLLRVDRVISASESDDDDDSILIAFLRSIIKFLSPNKPLQNPTRSQNSPAQILREFEKIRNLQIELPSGDLRLEKGTIIRWKAEFGKTLKSCVILGFRGGGGGGGGGGGDGEVAELGGGGGLKMRVVWTISALIAASARHYMMMEVVNEHKELENLLIKDREDEGKVVMDKKGLRECRECSEENEVNNGSSGNGGVGLWWRNNRTTVPAVRMRMRHEARMELSGGTKMVGATLVVVRPINERSDEVEEQNGDVGIALGAFGEDQVYSEAVERLLKSRSYILEMNSF